MAGDPVQVLQRGATCGDFFRRIELAKLRPRHSQFGAGEGI